MRKIRMNDYIRHWDNANCRWVYEHREIVERQIGRKLRSDEHIHHIDGNPRNNKLENLKIVSPAEHVRIHKPARKSKTCSVKGCNNKHHARGLCKKHYRQAYPEKYYSKKEVEKGWRISKAKKLEEMKLI